MTTTGRIVVVVGASSGIGAAAAQAFAHGDDLVVGTSRSGRLPDDRPDVQAHALDVTDDESVSSLMDALAARYGRIDVLVANAGRGFRGSTEQLDIADFHASLEVNFIGQVRLARAALPLLRAAGGGRIIAVSSLGGAIGQPFQDAYCAAKFALEGWLESWGPVASRFGTRITVVEPGAVAGSFGDHAHHAAAVDPRLGDLFAAYEHARAAAVEQTPAQIAEVIRRCADEPDPAARVQTSHLGARIVARKLNDLDGSAVARMTSSWLRSPG